MSVTVYVLEGKTTGRRYIGITRDLPARLQAPWARRSKGGQLIGEFDLIFSEVHTTYAEARVREKFLKSGQGRACLHNRRSRRTPA